MDKKYCQKTDRKTRYFDKTGEEIKAGMTLRHKDGEEKKVYECGDETGTANLGFMASNPEFLKLHPDWPVEYYPLEQFNLVEWVIVKEISK